MAGVLLPAVCCSWGIADQESNRLVVTVAELASYSPHLNEQAPRGSEELENLALRAMPLHLDSIRGHDRRRR